MFLRGDIGDFGAIPESFSFTDFSLYEREKTGWHFPRDFISNTISNDTFVKFPCRSLGSLWHIDSQKSGFGFDLMNFTDIYSPDCRIMGKTLFMFLSNDVIPRTKDTVKVNNLTAGPKTSFWNL